MKEIAVFNELISEADIDKTEWKNLNKYSTTKEAYEHDQKEKREIYETWLKTRKENEQDIYVRTVTIHKISHVILFDNYEKKMKIFVHPDMPTDPQKPLVR